MGGYCVGGMKDGEWSQKCNTMDVRMMHSNGLHDRMASV